MLHDIFKVPATGQICLSNLLVSALPVHGDKPAIVSGDTVLTYAALDRASESLAAYLAERGVDEGKVVALHLRNSIEYVIADMAILKLCAIKLPLNELMAPDELAYCLDHSEAAALIRHDSLPEASATPSSLRETICIRDTDLRELSSSGAWPGCLETPVGSFRRRTPSPDKIALIAYTGGTTGKSKGVVHLQSTLGLNVLAGTVCGDVRSDEVMLLTTPLPHSAGYHLQACLLQGGCVVLARKFDPASFVELASRHKATWTFAVPTMIYRLLDHLRGKPVALSHLRTFVYGAAPMSKERLEEGLSQLGPVFLQIYGQTECPNFITTLSKTDHLDRSLLTSCGRPVPFLEAGLHKEDGQPASAGEVGEIYVTSPYNLVSYYKNPEATDAALSHGTLRTGDLAVQDDRGYLHLVDRAKDMIISGGMNVYSVEVERVLRQFDAIQDAAVIGLPDKDWGERVVAVVTARDTLPRNALKEFLRQRLSAYKLPKDVIEIPSMPLTPYGKIDKKALRASLSETLK